MSQELSRRRYAKSPIAEVICELSFKQSSNDPTIWGEFHSKIKELYPQKITGKRVLVQNEKIEGKIAPKIKASESMRFSSEDGFESVQLAENYLSINSLGGSYQSFEQYKESVINAINAYMSVATPASFGKFRLRYISNIEIPYSSISLDEYFHYFPVVPQDNFSFRMRIDVVPFKTGHNTFLSIASLSTEDENACNFLVDINDSFGESNDNSLDVIITTLTEAHENIGRIFESLITDKTRELFEEVKDETCDW